VKGCTPKHILVDFNTLNSTPIDTLKLGEEGTPNGDSLPPVHSGERVLFYDDEILVEGTVECQMVGDHRYWLGAPDWSTRRQTPPELVATMQ
jgi:hypothetical protein